MLKRRARLVVELRQDGRSRVWVPDRRRFIELDRKATAMMQAVGDEAALDAVTTSLELSEDERRDILAALEEHGLVTSEDAPLWPNPSGPSPRSPSSLLEGLIDAGSLHPDRV